MHANPSKTLRYDLLVVLVGIACTLAVEDFVRDYSPSRLIATIAFFLTSLNFVHGKVVALDDEDYNRALIHRAGFALWDFVLSVFVVLAFVFMALYLDDPRKLLICNLAVRGIDIIEVSLVRRVSLQPVLRRAQAVWLRIDVFAIVLFSTALKIPAILDSKLSTATVFLALIFFDLIVDYSLNYDMYFSSSGSWEEMWDLWDALQGRNGDIYRQKIILPALSAMCDFNNKKVLDVGCGNGCISRIIEDQGAAYVVGVDKHSTMVAAARQYVPSRVQYRQLDVESSSGAAVLGKFDVIVACFTLQDCNSLDAPFAFIRLALAPKGEAFVIFENDAAFDGGFHTTGTRQPLDPESRSGVGRRWLISWAPNSFVDGLSTRPIQASAASKNYETITRQWSLASYLRAAAAANLELASSPLDLRPDVMDGDAVLGKYALKPRFSMLSLRRREDHAQTATSIPLVLIAGASGVGKSTLCHRLRKMMQPIVVVSLDDFYLSLDDPRLPEPSQPNWESVGSIDQVGATRAIHLLTRGRRAEIPEYDMSKSAVVGHKTFNPAGARAIVVYGVFAFDLFVPGDCRVTRILIVGSRMRLLYRRIKRDLAERRRNGWQILLHALKLIPNERAYHKINSRIADRRYPCKLPPDELARRISADLTERFRHPDQSLRE